MKLMCGLAWLTMGSGAAYLMTHKIVIIQCKWNHVRRAGVTDYESSWHRLNGHPWKHQGKTSYIFPICTSFLGNSKPSNIASFDIFKNALHSC